MKKMEEHYSEGRKKTSNHIRYVKKGQNPLLHSSSPLSISLAPTTQKDIHSSPHTHSSPNIFSPLWKPIFHAPKCSSPHLQQLRHFSPLSMHHQNPPFTLWKEKGPKKKCTKKESTSKKNSASFKTYISSFQKSAEEEDEKKKKNTNSEHDLALETQINKGDKMENKWLS